jgi:hypothetical protein
VSRLRAVVGFAVLLVAGCTAPRIVPVPSAGVEIDVGQGSATAAAEDVRLTVQPSAWRGSPWDLRDYVTPFLYFPRLRATTRTFSLQFHHRLGEMPRVLTLSFAVERGGTTSPGA